MAEMDEKLTGIGSKAHAGEKLPVSSSKRSLVEILREVRDGKW